MRQQRTLLYGFAITLSVLMGGLSHWKVFEFDLFFNVRAGAEIFHTWKIQTIDSWSHTVMGKPYFNFEWLSTLVSYLASRVLPGYAFLGWLRSIFISIWIFSVMRSIFWSLDQNKESTKYAYWVLPLILVPWIYVICSFRLQMRPDLYATLHYVGLLTLWQGARHPLKQKILSVLLLLSWSNFHSGTSPIGIFVFGLMILSTEGQRKLAWMGAAALTWILTPQGIHVATVLYENLIVYEHQLMNNPDFQPFTMKLLNFDNGGWIFFLWIPYTLFAVGAYFYLRNQGISFLPEYFRNPYFFILGCGLMTLVTFNKIRMIHYQVVFLVPIVAAGMSQLLPRLKPKGRPGGIILMGFFGVFLWWVVMPDQVNFISKPIGEGVNEIEIPVKAVEFIRSKRPKRNLYHAYQFGGYLIAELPDYPVFFDGRGIFQNLVREQIAASSSPQGFADFLMKYEINTVIESLPSMGYDKDRGFIDSHDTRFPRSEWALVFFDQISVVYLRRIPIHQHIISENEYHFIKRGFPAGFGASMSGLSDSLREGFRMEIERCLKQMPENTYCLVGKSTYERKAKRLKDALATLLRAQEINPRSPELLLELSSVYRDLGLPGEAKEAESRFKHLTHGEMRSGS